MEPAPAPADAEDAEEAEEAKEIEEAEEAPRRDLEHLVYAPGPQGVDDATYSTWWPGARLVAAADGANLREGPSSDSAVVAELELAQEVEVLEVSSAPTLLIQRRNEWVRVRAGEHEGWMFGAVLSPLSATLETHAGERTAVVSFSPDFHPRVRIQDGRKVVVRDLPMPHMTEGGKLSVNAAPWGSGTELMVRMCAVDGTPCAWFVLRKVGPTWVEGGTGEWPLRGDRHLDVELFPVVPQEPRRVANAVYRLKVDSQDGSDPAHWADVDIPCDVVGRAAGGSLVSCVGSPWDVGQSITRFIARSDGWWFVPNASDGANEELVDQLEDQNVRIAGVDPTVALPPPYLPPAVLIDDGRGTASFRNTQWGWLGAHKPIGSHPVFGSVFERSCSTVAVQTAGSTPETDAIFTYDWEPKTLHLTVADRDICIHPCRSWRTSFDPSGKEPVDTLGELPVYRSGGRNIGLDSWDRPFELLELGDCES